MSASVSRDAACTAWQLPNGLAVQVLSTPGKPRAAALLSVAAGSHNEPLAWPGLAHLLEHVLFGDSQQYRGAERLMPWTEAAGGQVNASTEAASTQFFFEVPAAALAEGVRRLVAMLALPAWSTEATMREVAVIDAEYRARGRDGDTLTEAALAWAVAEGHPLHRFCAGNRDALGACPAALQRALRAYHQRFFHAANMTLWLQGPQSEQALRAIAVACAPTLAVRPPGHPPAGPPPLNWRLAGPLTLRCPGMPRLVLAFAVTDMAAGASAPLPLPLFRQLLQDEAAGSLLDHLRVRGLCDGVRLLPCYQNADQGIVALMFSLLPGGITRGGKIAALLLRWLAALRELPPRSLRHYAGLADAALARLSPMQQLRARAGALIPPATPAVSPQACPSAPWARWLTQLDARAPLQLSIAADLPGRAVISQGFSLRLGDDGATPSAPPLARRQGTLTRQRQV